MKTNDAEEKPVQDDEKKPISEPVDATKTKAGGWNFGTMFWGLLLIVVGSLLLLGNMGIVRVDWMNLIRLWPLTIIAAGLSMLTVRGWLWRVVVGMFVVASMAAVVYVATGNYTGSTAQTYVAHVQKIDSGVKSAEVHISAGASKVHISTNSADDIATATLESNWARLSQSSIRVGDSTQRVELTTESDHMWWMMASVKSSWDVQLTRSMPLVVSLDAGASDTDADLSQAQLQSLDVKAGASQLRLTLGDKTVDTKVKIDSGASTVVVRVPKSSGVKLNLAGGLTSKSLADLRSIGTDEYTSDGYDSAQRKIEITANVGVASFAIERY